MITREATKGDLPRILELGQEFNHLMLYQKDSGIMEKCLPRILVAEESIYSSRVPSLNVGKIVGYYHYIVSGDPGFEEMLRCYRQFPEWLIKRTFAYTGGIISRGLCICMQGASHREVFSEFIKYLQERYSEIWNYCSIKSRRVDTYKELGFTYIPEEQFTFFNVSKGDYSTYQLGRWKK